MTNKFCLNIDLVQRGAKPVYMSNCLIEALKAKIKYRNEIKIIFVSPFSNDVFCPHWLWLDLKDNNVKDFHTVKRLKFWETLWFKGDIRTRPYEVFQRWQNQNKKR